MSEQESPRPAEPTSHEADKTRDLPPADASTVPDDPRLTGRRIGGYHLKRIIGGGGMGTVYLAVQEHPHRTVALKVMKPNIISRATLRRFESEAQILARLRHPNIAQVFEAGVHDEGDGEVPFFVMEYIPNAKSITEYVEDRGLGTRQRLELFAKVCAAVHHGHRKGIIHRDLKPGNILVDAEGEPKIIDFGVARSTDADLAVTTLQTNVGDLVGTIQYMSPEQVEADPHAIDARSDIYSLGVVLFEVLSGRLPYDVSHAAVIEAARIVKETPPSRLSTVNSTLRGDVETITRTALEKDPQRRYQSAADLQQDVVRCLNDQPILARRPSLLYTMLSAGRGLLRRNPFLMWVGIVVVAACGAWILGRPVLASGGTPAHEQFKHLVATMGWPGGGGKAFEAVRVIRITDDTATSAERLADALDLEGVDVRHWWSMRRLHGRLMERLAAAGVRSVTWNITFRSERDVDADFAHGVEALREVEAEVVVGVRDWPLVEGRRPDISPVIYDANVRWGGTTVKFVADEPWALHLFAQRGAGDPRPSLPLASAAAYLKPGSQVDYTVDERSETLRLRYFRYPDLQHIRDRRYLKQVDEITLSTIEKYRADPAEGREAGDVIGIYLVEVPSDPLLERSTIDYEWVFEADPAELRGRVEGTAVVIGDFRAGRAPVASHPDGRTLSTTYGYAAGLDMLLRGGAIRVVSGSLELLAVVLGAVVGVVIAGVLGSRRWVRWGVLFGVAVAAFFAGILAYHLLACFVNPLVSLMAMVVACELAVGVNRARRARFQ